MTTLVTKLPESVFDDTLPKLDELRIGFKYANRATITLQVRDNNGVPADGGLRLSGSSYFTNSNGDNLGTELANVIGTRNIMVSPGEGFIFYSPKNRLSLLAMYSGGLLGPDGLKYSGVRDLTVDNLKDEYGDKADVKLLDSPELLHLRVYTTGPSYIKGSVNDLRNLKNMITLGLYNQGVDLDLSGLSGSTSILEIRGIGSKLSGSIMNLSSAKMSVLESSSATVTGAAEDLLDAFFANGKTSGTCRISSYGSGITYGGSTYSGDKVFTFTASGWTLNT